MCPDSPLTPSPDIWENGVSLSEADYFFAGENLRAKYDLPQIPLPIQFLTKIVTLVAQPKDKGQKLVYDKLEQINRDALDSSRSYLSAVSEAQDLLLSDLGKRKLIAYGFVTPRKPADTRTRIPTDLFKQRYVNWGDSAIKGAGLEFASVLVFKLELAQEIDAQLAKKAPAKGTRTKRGPPPSSHAIEEAIRSLIKDGTFPNHNQQKQNIGIVQARVHKLQPGEFPHNRGLSNESVRVVLAKLIPRARI